MVNVIQWGGLVVALVLSISSFGALPAIVPQNPEEGTSLVPTVSNNNRNKASTRMHSTSITTSITDTQQETLIVSGANYTYTGPPLWIEVNEFAEGMASWRLALAEIVLVAKQVNATLVEPCILAGRLRACREGASYRLGQVYDLNVLREFHPHMVSYSYYEEVMASGHKPKIFPMCMAHPSGSPPAGLVCGDATSMYQMERNTVLEEALGEKSGVIRILYYRKGAFAKTKLRGRELLRPRPIKRVLTTHFEFHQEHYRTVDRLLVLMGITSPIFDVVHWRAEGQQGPMDYEMCADSVIQARRTINNETVPTVLISSLNRMPNLQWATFFLQRLAGSSLQRLLDADFRKIDQVSQADNQIPDMVALGVWDQIMAQKAREFVTCSKSCGKNNPCSRCNYQGNFGEMAIDLRSREGKSSHKCWPDQP